LRTLSDLAECYETWASESEAAANTIIANLTDLDAECRATQLNWAEELRQEARYLRQQAAIVRET
jgi:hypothetical protein